MLNTTKYQGNGALIEHSDYTSSYADTCSVITTSNVVETTTRGGGDSTTKSVVESLQTFRHAELVSASPNLTRRFRNKFGMTLCVTLLICAFATANLSAQTGCPPYADAITHTIASNEFRNSLGRCPTLTDIVCPLVTSIGNGAFQGCMGLLSVDFPNAESIESSAFSGCSSLVSVDIPSVTSIEVNTFYFCTSLESVEFPVATSIGNAAFSICTSLESVEFPVATNIESNAFAYCTSLVSITLGAVPPTLGTNVFAGTTNIANITLHIPEGSLCAYQNHPDWGSTFLAQFYDVVEYSVATPVTYYTLSLDDDGNGTAAGSGGSLTGITCGNSRTITATPNPCYQFAKWTNSNGDSISNVSSLNISVIRDTLLKANFKLVSPAPTYTLSVSSNPTMGTASSSVSSATCGSSVSVTATPNAGYRFVYWQEGGAIVSNANPHNFNITANRALTAVFDDAKKKTRIKKINVKKGRVIITPQP
ncbi:MAG: leucine-rich repeat protein [Bacteroidetes bacterium]|nr:leucine-rich repeat protein [Bacteroidota bacterium]